MNEASADSPAMMPTPSHAGWSRRKLVSLVALAFVAHVALIFVFGTKRQIQPRAAANVPQIRLANPSDELVALGNPALFALPNPRDFAAAIRLKMPVVAPSNTNWTEEPRWLRPVTQNLGAALNQFIRTNRPSGTQFDFKPPPQFASPLLSVETALPQNSTLQIRSDLAQRLLSPLVLPSLPFNDVVAPSKVQILVNPSGYVVSAVLLPSRNPVEANGRREIGDTNALAIARSLRFAPAARSALGEIIFNWHTIPLPATNAPVRQ